MNESVITILTGPVHSGKTTWLKNNYAQKENVFGILTPIVNERRVFLNIATGEIFPMEASAEEKEVLTIGRYYFSKIGFQKAVAILSDSLKQKEGMLILDEVGPLELRREGFYEVAKKIVSDTNPNLKKLIVVRESILQATLDFFTIHHYQITRL